ncbi:hypothetical protein ADUPG1_001850 [Aduncisulcus paluster]|uniref:Uncharacterized protein n=1 Tax=Aduncisulcus paluster TaxID=2918883 RepID=A0ABQ5KF01_9EUKA|nr:hypothetical protein ADUPG1_001850 [Aduncisulcus paluster]
MLKCKKPLDECPCPVAYYPPPPVSTIIGSWGSKARLKATLLKRLPHWNLSIQTGVKRARLKIGCMVCKRNILFGKIEKGKVEMVKMAPHGDDCRYKWAISSTMNPEDLLGDPDEIIDICTQPLMPQTGKRRSGDK